MSVKIETLTIENTKRVRHVALQISPDGLTVLGGRNGQGKTSVLDTIMYLLGGEKYRPDVVKRQGSMNDPMMSLTLSNGLTVSRRGKNSALTVIDNTGHRGGQTLLNEFVGTFALDLPKFLNGTDKDRAAALLAACGLEDAVADIDRKIKAAEENRRIQFSDTDHWTKYAEQLPVYDGVPVEPLSAAELIRQQQEILSRNGMRQQWQQELTKLMNEDSQLDQVRSQIEIQISQLRDKLEQIAAQKEQLAAKIAAASKSPDEMMMEDTAELEHNLKQIEEINKKVTANKTKAEAQATAEQKNALYDTLNEQVQELRKQRLDLFAHGQMPLPELTVTDDYKVAYKGIPWGDMSGAEQMIVGASIAAAQNPKCGFVLIDKLEQLDPMTMQNFNQWLVSKGLQAIATRVTTNPNDCSIIIEDGEALESASPVPFTENNSPFRAVPGAAPRPWENGGMK